MTSGQLASPQNEDLRQRALASLKKKRDFISHLFTYLLVNGMLVGIWAVTGAGFFWPIFLILGWGIGIVLHGWDVYRPEPSEEEIRKEIERLK